MLIEHAELTNNQYKLLKKAAKHKSVFPEQSGIYNHENDDLLYLAECDLILNELDYNDGEFSIKSYEITEKGLRFLQNIRKQRRNRCFYGIMIPFILALIGWVVEIKFH